MTRTLFALAIAIVGVVFSVVSGTSGAAPTAPLSAGAPQDNGSAMQGSHDGRGGDRGKRSAFGRGGMFAKLGSLRPLVAMLASGQGGAGGLPSMFGSMGGSTNMSGITSMIGSMAGTGDMGGLASMIRGTAGSSGAQSTTLGQISQSARQACTPDALRLCSDYIPDVGKTAACMRAKSSQLSEPCRAAMTSESANLSRLAGRGTAASASGQGLAGYVGPESATNASSVQNFGGFEAGGIDIGQMIGMAQSLGFGLSGR